MLKEFAAEFATIIRDIYNQLLRERFLPPALKKSIIFPLPKISPPQDIKTDLRPIALTCCLAKVLEGFTLKRLLKQVNAQIDPRQYPRHGHSTTHDLIYLLHAIYEAVVQETVVLVNFLPTSQRASTLSTITSFSNR